LKDLVVLVPDRDLEAALRGVLSRPEALQTRQVEYDLFVHPMRDPGCFHEADIFLGPFQPLYAHALVVFDAAWGGAPSNDPLELEGTVKGSFERRSLAPWAGVVVVSPEVEAWIWSDSPRLPAALGWSASLGELRAWLEERGLWPPGALKPPDPKLAVKAVRRQVGLPPSASIFTAVARTVSFQRCSDPAFLRLCGLLRGWFPRPASG